MHMVCQLCWLDRCYMFSSCLCNFSELGGYFTRKGNYAIKGLLICDDIAEITWIEMWWPGSVHDNWVWSNSNVYLSKKKYFGNKEFLLGDSAFSASSVMLPGFKMSPNANLSKFRTYFNTKLADLQIKSEHCIWLLKARFQCLQGHQYVIQSKHDLDVILQTTMCERILHNLYWPRQPPRLDGWQHGVGGRKRGRRW